MRWVGLEGTKRERKSIQEGSRAIYRDIPEQLRALIEPIVEDHGCELVDVEVARNRGQGLLRITVDSPDGDGRVPIERCVAISREVETGLDAEDAMTGAYQLEVSSPGLDRLLGREKDFVGALGERLKLRTRRPIEGRKRFTGRLDAVEPGSGASGTTLTMDIDGTPTVIPLDEVEKANTVYEFSSADFSSETDERGGSKRKPPGRGRGGKNAKQNAGKRQGAGRTGRAR